MAFLSIPLKEWLGASPDALVFDPSSVSTDGIAEFKCLYSKADIDPKEACEDKSFYCCLVDNKLHLNRNHPYYHQIVSKSMKSSSFFLELILQI